MGIAFCFRRGASSIANFIGWDAESGGATASGDAITNGDFASWDTSITQHNNKNSKLYYLLAHSYSYNITNLGFLKHSVTYETLK